MKRDLLILFMLLFGLGAIAQNVNDNSKWKELNEKALKKEIKKTVKEWKKEGWQPYGTSEKTANIARNLLCEMNDDDKLLIIGAADSIVDLEEGMQLTIRDAFHNAVLSHLYHHSDVLVTTDFDETTDQHSITFVNDSLVVTEQAVVKLENGDSIMTRISYSSTNDTYKLIQKELRKGYMYTMYRKTNKKQGGANIYEMKSYFVVNANAQTIESKGDTTVNAMETLKNYRMAAERGDATAQYNMGQAYRLGYGVDKDYKEAAKWYRMAAEQGDADAQYLLGSLYANGLGVAQDTIEAIEWYRLSAEQGNAHALYYMGQAYRLGYGVDKDNKEAARCYRLSAEKGLVISQCLLGLMYITGTGVDKDPVEAMKWYKNAAEQGDRFSQVQMGRLYELGIGVQMDTKEALKWYRMAADQDDEEAQEKVKKLENESNTD